MSLLQEDRAVCAVSFDPPQALTVGVVVLRGLLFLDVEKSVCRDLVQFRTAMDAIAGVFVSCPLRHRLKEAGKINYSLSVLSHVIRELVERGGGGGGEDRQGENHKNRNNHHANRGFSHIPYRDSKLTFLLMDALGGTSRTTLIATLSPSLQHLAESISTLQFASMSKRIKNKTTANEVKIWDKGRRNMP